MAFHIFVAEGHLKPLAKPQTSLRLSGPSPGPSPFHPPLLFHLSHVRTDAFPPTFLPPPLVSPKTKSAPKSGGGGRGTEEQKDAAGCPAKRSFSSRKEKTHALLCQSDKKENQIKKDVLSSFVKADKNNLILKVSAKCCL